MKYNHSSIPKLQRLHREVEKLFHITIGNGCNGLSMVVLKSILLSKKSTWYRSIATRQKHYTKIANRVPDLVQTAFKWPAIYWHFVEHMTTLVHFDNRLIYICEWKLFFFIYIYERSISCDISHADMRLNCDIYDLTWFTQTEWHLAV